ncbi:hypothetical protein FACS189430_10850 [Bacteroidia bacterium]|nr:hypothetical protein FACS189430_10850 [Bacteroidia bacterium]
MIMSTIELEAQKTKFVRDFLNETNEDVVQDLILYFFKTRDKIVKQSEQSVPVLELNLQAKRKKIDEALNKHLIDLSNFTFNRDEANDYE